MSVMRSRMIAAAATLLVIGPVALVSLPADGATRHLPHTNCPVFPANNCWHADVSGLPRQRSQRPVALAHVARYPAAPGLRTGVRRAAGPYGIPITVVGGNHRQGRRERSSTRSESDQVRYPLGGDTKIEGGRSSGRPARDRRRQEPLPALRDVRHRSAERRWHAGSGATWSLTSNDLRPNGWTSADAAGLPILPGLLRFGEVEAGKSTTRSGSRPTSPTGATCGRLATTQDRCSSPAYPPMGARFRLGGPSDLVLPRRHPDVLRAMKRYGLVLADNGSPWFFQGPPTAAGRGDARPAQEHPGVGVRRRRHLLAEGLGQQRRRPPLLPMTRRDAHQTSSFATCVTRDTPVEHRRVGDSGRKRAIWGRRSVEQAEHLPACRCAPQQVTELVHRTDRPPLHDAEHRRVMDLGLQQTGKSAQATLNGRSHIRSTWVETGSVSSSALCIVRQLLVRRQQRVLPSGPGLRPGRPSTGSGSGQGRTSTGRTPCRTTWSTARTAVPSGSRDASGPTRAATRSAMTPARRPHRLPCPPG